MQAYEDIFATTPRGIFSVGLHSLQTEVGTIHIMSFMNMVGVSKQYEHLAYDRLATLETSSLDWQLSQAAYD